MGHQVVIKFIGLCIHVHKSDFPQLPCEHRVILLANEQEKIQGQTIDAHQPELRFLPSAPTLNDVPCLESRGENVFRLHGARLRIPNGADPLTHNETFDRVPHLAPLGSVLPPPDLDVILSGKAPATAYFDVDQGTFSACRSTAQGALGATLVIDTGGAVPAIEISCGGGTPKTIELVGPEPRLHITNVAASGRDDDADYLLNYRILTSIPEGVSRPDPDLEGLGYCVPELDLDFGPPCSNTGYP